MREIKLTETQIDALQSAAMYGEPIGGRVVHLFIEDDPYEWGSYPCGCCTCCGCDCWMDDVDGDYFYDDDLHDYVKKEEDDE